MTSFSQIANAQNFSLRLDENNLPSGYTDDREAEAAIVEFHDGANDGTLICRAMLNANSSLYDLVLIAYDLSGTQLNAQVIPATSFDLVPAGACYNSNTGEYLIYGNVTNSDPWYVTVNNGLNVMNDGAITSPTVSPNNVLTLTDAVAVVNSPANVDFSFVARNSASSGNLFNTGSSLVLIEIRSTATMPLLSYVDITSLGVTPSSTYDLGVDGFGTNIVEITSSTNGGYFITGRVDNAAFYMRTDYLTASTNMRAYAIEYASTTLNAMAACYYATEDIIYVAGTASNSTHPMGFFFDKLSSVSSQAPGSLTYFNTPLCRSNVFISSTSTEGLPILYMDNTTLASCDNFGNIGFPSVESMSREILYNGEIRSLVAIRLNDVNYTIPGTCTSNPVSSNYMLPGLISLTGVDDEEFTDLSWNTSTNAGNWFYPRYDGNSAPVYYDNLRDLNNMYYPHKQFFTYEPNTTSTDQHAMIGSYTTFAGNPQEPVLIQNDNDYIENGCSSILTQDIRINVAVNAFHSLGTPTLSNPTPTYALVGFSNNSITLDEDNCIFNTNLFKTTSTTKKEFGIDKPSLLLRENILHWSGDNNLIAGIDIISVSGQKIKSLSKFEIESKKYGGEGLAQGLYIVQLKRTDNSSQNIKWIVN